MNGTDKPYFGTAQSAVFSIADEDKIAAQSVIDLNNAITDFDSLEKFGQAIAAAKALAAEQAAKEALEKGEEDATEKVAAAEAARKAAEDAQKQADTDKTAAEQAAKDAADAQEAAEAAAKQAEADKAAADLATAKKVIDKIKAIGKVKKTNDCESAIIAARSAYDTLNDDQKALVTNYDVLQKAEAAYKLLPQTGTTGTPNVIAAMAVLMGLTGVALVRKSRKDEKEVE